MPSPARKLGVAVNREASFESQFMVSLAVCLNSRVEGKNNLVLDRTPVDSLAYSHYQKNNIWPEVDDFEFDAMQSICIRSMKNFDRVYYFPIYWKPIADGFRDTDVKYQQDIGYEILNILEFADLDFVVVPNLNPEERIQWLKEDISANLHV